MRALLQHEVTLTTRSYLEEQQDHWSYIYHLMFVLSQGTARHAICIPSGDMKYPIHVQTVACLQNGASGSKKKRNVREQDVGMV